MPQDGESDNYDISQAEHLSGELDGRYKVISIVASGATARVYKAQHLLLGTFVAIKVMKLNCLDNPASLVRFQQEARVLSQLVHPQLVKVMGFGVLADGRPYLIMEFIAGRTLAEIIASDGALESERALPLFIQIADSMIAVHQLGILHRDLKPANVMISRDDQGVENAKVLDFGLVRGLIEIQGCTLTQTGMTVGSPAYMSPEQCLNKQLSVQSDIYSMGCLMYETLCGAPPFTGETPLVVMSKQVDTQIITIPGKRILTPGLTSILLKALQKDESKRQQNMKDLKDELERCQQGELPLSYHKTGWKLVALARTIAVPLISISVCATCICWLAGEYSRKIAGFHEKINSLNKKDQNQKIRTLKRLARSSSLLSSTAFAQLCGKDRSLSEAYFREWLRCNPQAPLLQKAQVWKDLAVALTFQAREGEAREYYDKAESAYRAMLNHPSAPEAFDDIATCCNGLALIDDHLGKLAEEESLLKQGLQRLKDVAGAGNTYTIEAMEHLAGFYGVQQRYKEQESLLKDILVLRTEIGEDGRAEDRLRIWHFKLQETKGVDQLRRFRFLHDLGINQWRLNKLLEAGKYLKQYYQVLESGGCDISDSERCQELCTLSSDFFLCHDYKMSARVADAAWQLAEKSRDKIPNGTLFGVNKLASRAYFITGEKQKAQEKLDLALRLAAAESALLEQFRCYTEILPDAINLKNWSLAQSIVAKEKELCQNGRQQFTQMIPCFLYDQLFLLKAQPGSQPGQITEAIKDATEIILSVNENSHSQDDCVMFICYEHSLVYECVSHRVTDQAVLLYDNMLQRIEKAKLKPDPGPQIALEYAKFLKRQNRSLEASALLKRYNMNR